MSGAVAGHVEHIMLKGLKEIIPDKYAPALFWAGRYESLTNEDALEYILNCFTPS